MEGTLGIAQQQPPPGGEVPIPVQLNPANATPVYGTAQPTAGLPAQIHREAYRHPSHDPMRWLLLLTADRVESAGEVARETLTPGAQGLVIRHFRRQIVAHPAGAVAWLVAAGAIAGGITLAPRVLRCVFAPRTSS